MRKKGVILLLAALMVWALAAPASAAVNPFSDVKSDHWAYEAIITLAAAGLIEGYPDGTFGGDRNFTRYEMAMVFARILARFEALIDQKIADGIDARTEALAAEIAATRDELAKKIEANYDRIWALETDVAVLEGQVKNIFNLMPGRGLSADAEAALREIVADEIRAQLEAIGAEDLTDLAERILRLEGSTPSRSEAELIAERVVADALGGPSELAIRAANGDAQALEQLINERVNQLGSRVEALLDEFEAELTQLGLDVARLENRVRRVEAKVERNEVRITRAEAAISDLRDRIGNVVLTGKNETKFEHTAITQEPGANPKVDPRDNDSDDINAENAFTNTLNLTLTATPAENVEVKASLDVVSDVYGVDEDDPADDDFFRASANVDLTTPGVLRSLHVGDIDDDKTAEHFDKYTLVASDDSDNWRGANANLVFGRNDSTSVQTFVTRVAEAKHAFGAAVAYGSSDRFGLTLRGVRLTTSPQATAPPLPGAIENISNVSVEATGSSAALDFRAVYATNADDDPATAIEAEVEMPIAAATARFDYGAIGTDWNSAYGREFEEDDPDWLMRHLHPDEDKDPLVEGQREHKVTLSAPILGAQVAVAFGQRDETETHAKHAVAVLVRDQDTFTQVEVSDIHFAGIDFAVLYDRRINEASATDQTMRTDLSTSILGLELGATVHNRNNEQAHDPGEDDQRSVWARAKQQFNLLLPVTLDARFGTNQVLDMTASKVGVSTEVPLGSITLKGGYVTEQNAIGGIDDDPDKVWWRNSSWSNDKRDTVTAGASYTLKGVFGADIDTSYEYKLIRINDADHGTAQNTYAASFEKQLRNGEATLAGEGKLVTGGVPGHDGNDRDLTASVSLTYPVFAGGKVTLGGKYISSTGDMQPDYDVVQVNAGMTVEF